MKKTVKRFILASAISIITLGSSFSQVGDIGNMLAGGVGDAEIIMTEYLRPLANSLGANLNSGWYTTAKVHGLGGFHLNFTLSTTFVPDLAKSYDLSEMGLSADPITGDAMAATFFGERGNGPTLAYSEEITPGNNITVADYPHPGGIGIGFFPSPMINAGVGLPKGFEVLGRYMPTMKFKGLQTDMWGLGIKHDIGQWIPFVKRVPVLHFTLQYGYTKLSVSQALNVTPQTIGLDASNDVTTSKSWDDQSFDMVTQAHTANFLVGANLPVVCFYGGVGIAMSKTSLDLNGDFPVPTITTVPPIEPVITDASAVTDPLSIEIKNQDGGIMKPRLNAGIRFKFAVITLHFDYTYANYSVASAGLGISFR
jgi:hypothetical protein